MDQFSRMVMFDGLMFDSAVSSPRYVLDHATMRPCAVSHGLTAVRSQEYLKRERPPSTNRVAPVMDSAPSEHRKTAP